VVQFKAPTALSVGTWLLVFAVVKQVAATPTVVVTYGFLASPFHSLFCVQMGNMPVFDCFNRASKRFAKPTIKIPDTETTPILLRAEAATLPKKKRNTTPIQEPDAFADVCH